MLTGWGERRPFHLITELIDSTGWPAKPAITLSETSHGKRVTWRPGDDSFPWLVSDCHAATQRLSNRDETGSRPTRLCVSVPRWLIFRRVRGRL